MFRIILPRFIFRVERWKWNKEYRIYVSNMGHFMDEHKKIIPVKINQNGYVLIKTAYGYESGHRLVMKTWRPTAAMDKLTVDHLDHNKRNNAVENLEWVTEAENKSAPVKITLTRTPSRRNPRRKRKGRRQVYQFLHWKIFILLLMVSLLTNHLQLGGTVKKFCLVK